VAGVFRRRGWLEERHWLRGAAVTLVIVAPLTVAVWWITGLFFGAPEGFDGLGSFFLPVLAVSAVMTAITEMAQRTPVQTHAAPAGAPPARFLDRLPPKLRGGELYAVEAEDHYLRLHTSRGSDLILMRLSDAVVELEGLEGAQTHRSWWVAKSAMEDARRSDGRALLLLKGGVQAPVSRTYAKALRQAGWF
jgi:DNA-binding LytR/AlgR family response regulator